jgi:hypothetical protein
LFRARIDEKHDQSPTPAECVGYTLCDPLKREIGEVEQLFANGYGEACYVMVRIRAGFFGRRSVLIPVAGVVVNAERRTITLG